MVYCKRVTSLPDSPENIFCIWIFYFAGLLSWSIFKLISKGQPRQELKISDFYSQILQERLFEKESASRRFHFFKIKHKNYKKKTDGFSSDRCLYDWVIMPGSLHKLFFCQFPVTILNYDLVNLPLRFRKARRVWCGGAREIHWATCHNRVTPSYTKEFLKSPRFLRS